jgi:hypothetical protein
VSTRKITIERPDGTKITIEDDGTTPVDLSPYMPAPVMPAFPRVDGPIWIVPQPTTTPEMSPWWERGSTCGASGQILSWRGIARDALGNVIAQTNGFIQ